MSEKFDGQRAVWDGKKFISRGSSTGHPKVYSYIPIWFSALMPPGVALDGEFFIARDSFSETTSVLKKKLKPENQRAKKDISQMDLDKLWTKVKYQVFDTMSTTDELFEERQTKLKEIVSERCKIWKDLSLPGYLKKGSCPLVLTQQFLIKNQNDINKFYTALTDEKAEGVMIRAPGIPYIPRRTKFILKMKVEDDAECIIKGPHKPGEGKYSGMVGSFRCQLVENQKPIEKYTYLSGITDEVRKKGIPDGTLITYTLNGYTSDGLPRHPRFKGFPLDR
jgi:DNA ligase-1